MPDKNTLYNMGYLQRSANLFKEVKEKSYIPFRSIKKGTIADLGCGIGIDALNLAGIVVDPVKILGLDNDQQMIDKANSSIKNLKNVEFKLANVENLPFENEFLSGIRNERLIQHLRDPEKAFKEFHRALKTKHPIVIVETDWSNLTFYNGIPGITGKVKDYFESYNVTNGAAAINISYYLKETGFKEISLNIFPVVSYSLEQVIAFTKIDYVLNQMMQKNYISSDEHTIFWNALHEADTANYFACTINLIIASAIK